MQLFLDSHNQLGECVLWCEKTQALFWTDIVAGKLCRLTVPGKVKTEWAMPEPLASFALTDQDDILLLGLASRLAFFSLSTHTITTICSVEADLPTTRINDGRCDRAGRFVFGTLNQEPGRARLASFYRLNHDLVLERLPLAPVAIANSICFSPDGARMYYCDSLAKAIYCCDYDNDSAAAFVPQLFTDLRDQAGVPDGSVVDAAGYLWNAVWGGAAVKRYSPDGLCVLQLDLPVSQPTCPAFGGADFNTLFVSSATDELTPEALSAQPLAGALFAHQFAGLRGLPEQRFLTSVGCNNIAPYA